MERVPFSGSAVLKGVRTCADPRKLQLGQAQKVCMALDSGCTTHWKDGGLLLVRSDSSGLPRFTQAGGSTQCWLRLCLALLTVTSEGQLHSP